MKEFNIRSQLLIHLIILYLYIIILQINQSIYHPIVDVSTNELFHLHYNLKYLNVLYWLSLMVDSNIDYPFFQQYYQNHLPSLFFYLLLLNLHYLILMLNRVMQIIFSNFNQIVITYNGSSSRLYIYYYPIKQSFNFYIFLLPFNLIYLGYIPL